MSKPGSYHVRVLKMGQCQVPGPEVYWMSHWEAWETIYFFMVLIQGNGQTAIINTGPPQDLTELNRFCQDFVGERGLIVRQENERPQNALQSCGIEPEDVQLVFLTPLQSYATANVPLFQSARICLSRRGWIEDFHAPPREIHVPRKLRIPDETLQYLCISAPEQLCLLSDEPNIIWPGIRTWWVGTHHRSSMAIAIDTPKGTVVASDCFFKYGNIEQHHPLGIAESLEECHQAYEKIRQEADILLPLYDPEVLDRHPGGIVV